MTLKAGAQAPDFTLPRDGSGSLGLSEFKGRKLVLYFYPKADTEGCTKEAIAFSGLKAKFARADTDIVGVSADPVRAQDRFRDKHGLKIALGSDETKKMLEAYGVWGEKSMYGRSFMGVIRKTYGRKYMGIFRTTYLIGPDGRIAKVWENVKVAGHAEDVLAAAKAL